jgi:hypothetical protein
MSSSSARLWKQGIGSTVHCVAGDATGIVVAAAVISALSCAMRWDVTAPQMTAIAILTALTRVSGFVLPAQR